MEKEPLHPLIGQLKPSDEQRPAIVDRGRDIVVTAGAGAGKTLTLVARYLTLLSGDPPLPLRSIVAITFTKKAAREMRNRVRRAMHDYLGTPGLPEDERQRWQDLYTALDAARIGTIHSLCTEILRHHPAEAGVDPRFEVLEETQAALLQAQAVDETLGWAANNEAAVGLFVLLGERELRKLAQALLQRRLDVAEALAAVPEDPAALRAHWEKFIEAARAAAHQALRAHPAFVAAAAVVRGTEPLDPSDLLVEAWTRAREALDRADDPAALAGLEQVKPRGGKQTSWPGGAAGVTEIRSALKTLRELWKAQAEWLTLALGPLDQALSEHYPALRAILSYATERYAALKAELRVLDFDDLEAGAARLLRDHPEVRSYWQREVRALLVDEFQDTNHRQRDLLDLLNGDEGKLFIVGDGKQSIYRFRGADVTVFRQKKREIERRGAAYVLATSYRAHQALIDLLNDLLRPVLGTAEDEARPYVEPFAELKPKRPDPPAGLPAPFLRVQLAVADHIKAARERAARALAEWLVELVEGPPVWIEEYDPESESKELRRLNYGDVAILCRAAKSFAAYEDALEEAGIPFLTVAGRGFYERPEVRDALNALQAIADPADDLALAGLLRSPAGGLSDMALYRLVQARQERAPHSPLWDILSGADLSFLEAEAPRAARVRQLVHDLHGRAGRVPVADVLKAFLDETDYRAALLRAGQARGVRNLNKLLADAHASQIVEMGAFLDYARKRRDAGTREGEAFAVAKGAVQLLTVHAAKGLEFPIVVIGDAGRKPRRAGGPLVDPAMGVLLPLEQKGNSAEPGQGEKQERPAAYRLAQRAAQEQESAEDDRLLYVAATRAREMLVISGAMGGQGLAGWLERLCAALPLVELLDTEGGAVHEWALGGRTAAGERYAAEEGRPARRAAAVPPEEVALPEALPMLFAPPAEPAGEDERARQSVADPPPRVWRVVPDKERPAAPAWVVGQIVHGALAGGILPAASEEGFAAWAEAEARSYGLTDDQEIHDAVRRAARMLRRFQEHPLCGEMAGALQRLHEVPYSLPAAAGAVESGTLDTLYRNERGWVLVEFKTDRVADRAALDDLLARTDYVKQVGQYLAAAERLLGSRPRPVLCFLNCGGEVALIEDRWG